MDSKIIAGILGFSVLALIVGILIPGGELTQSQTLPWQIEHTADGSTRVFGLILGTSTLQDAEHKLQAAAEINLFDSPDKPRVVEAYFDKISLGGLSAKMIIEIEVSPGHMQAIFERGIRIATLGNGTRKVTLQDNDLALARNSPIISIAYLPRARLEQDLIYKRFGEPAQRITEAESNTTHWLYPQLGLDVALDADGSAVLQYVAPAEFARLTQPLRK